MISSPPQRINPDVFTKMEAFAKKCTEGKKIASDDVTELYSVIVNGMKSNSQLHAPTATANSDASQNARIIASFKETLGRSKSVIEAASRGVPFQKLADAVNELELYAKAQLNDSKKVGRKESSDIGRQTQ